MAASGKAQEAERLGPARGAQAGGGGYAGQRAPSQERSRRRLEAVVAAAETLLETACIEDLSLYDIARQARMPPASVSYLFPTMAALQMELRRRHDRQLCARMLEIHERLARTGVSSWQAWLRLEAGEARAYYDRHRLASEALLGPLLDRKVRQANLDGNAMTGASTLANMRRVFDVPDLPGLERRFASSCELLELFWAASYMSQGFIDDTAFELSLAASIGYLRNFLPETLARRRDFEPDVQPHTGEPAA